MPSTTSAASTGRLLAALRRTSSAAPRVRPVPLDHLRTMIDDTGLIQHATFGIPNLSEGYTTDDNARAVQLFALLDARPPGLPAPDRRLATRVRAFLQHAWNGQDGRLRNFMAFDRRWLEAVGSEDCHGRGLLALATVAGRGRTEADRSWAERFFARALPAAEAFSYPQGWALTALALDERARGGGWADQREAALMETAGARLLAALRAESRPGWNWFTPMLTYANARLAHGLLAAGHRTGRGEMIEAALGALAWLADIQRPGGGHFVPIGCHGFAPRGGPRARYDQQPIEAQVMVSACLAADRVAADRAWGAEARVAWEWFNGANDLGVPMAEPDRGACFDGLQEAGINRNQGAESTLALLLAAAEIDGSESDRPG